MSINAPNMQDFSVSKRDAGSSTWNDNGPRGLAVVERRYFDETLGSAAGSHKAYVHLPKGSFLIDIIIYAEALWNDGTSASMQVGDYDTDGDAIDADGYFTALNLVSAGDLAAQETVRLSGNLATGGGAGGAYTNVGTNTHLTDLYYPNGATIVGEVAVGAGTGTTGKTHMAVIYACPYSDTAEFTAS